MPPVLFVGLAGIGYALYWLPIRSVAVAPAAVIGGALWSAEGRDAA